MLTWMNELIDHFLSFLESVLPTSPFSQYIESFKSLPGLSYLNYFIPITTFVRIGVAWLGAIGLFYLYSIIMRWVKMIGD